MPAVLTQLTPIASLANYGAGDGPHTWTHTTKLTAIKNQNAASLACGIFKTESTATFNAMQYSRLKRHKPIPKMSAKRKRELPLYLEARKKFLEENPTCQICKAVPATEIHHKKRRRRHYLDVATFMALCNACHRFVEANPKWSEENGYLDPHR